MTDLMKVPLMSWEEVPGTKQGGKKRKKLMRDWSCGIPVGESLWRP